MILLLQSDYNFDQKTHIIIENQIEIEIEIKFFPHSLWA